MRTNGQPARICRTIDLGDAARAGLDIGGAQLGRQQMPAAEHVQGQSSVAPRSRMICFGARLCASRNSVTGSASIAAAS